ncbi:MAG TPA: AAA family ATPase [Allosphingosinicella sp.]|jgi:tetratricopeptide (TPR) repeat protein
MSWQDFEEFALDVLGAQYGPQGIILRSTGAGPDGGRDAEGKLRIGTLDALAVELLLWVEIKHHNSPVGRKGTGSHLVAAINAAANILVIVSSSGFSGNFRNEVELFSFRAGIRTVLIDGPMLLDIASAAVPPPQGAIASEPPALPSPCLAIRQMDFSLSSLLATGMGRSRLVVPYGTPVFAAVSFEFRCGGGCHDVAFEMHTDCPGIEFVPLSTDPILRAAPGERLTRVFLVNGAPGARVAVSDIVCQAVATGEAAASFDVRGIPDFDGGSPAGSVEFVSPTVAFCPTLGQAAAIRRIADLHAAWRAKGGVASVSIEAAAGVGKSALVRRARWSWLEQGAREVVVDGATENSVWSLFRAILAHLLPTEGALAAAFGLDDVREWFEALGAPSAVAIRLADAVSRGGSGEGDFTPGELTDVLAAMLRRCALRRPLVFVFEDLHKVGGSVLRLIHVARERLRLDQGVPVLFCFSSRFIPDRGPGETVAEAWVGERERLLGDEHSLRLQLDVPSVEDARALLEQVIPYLYAEVADDMIDRVGTTPLALGELVRFLVERGALELEEVSRSLRINPAADLRAELRAADLVSRTATDQRLRLLIERLPAWGKDLVDAAACVGREFETNRIVTHVAAAAIPAADVDALLGELLREAVVGPTSRSISGNWRFEHDVVREAVLHRLALREHRARHLGLVRKLNVSADWPADVSLSLSYQAGDAEEFLRVANEAGERLRRRGYHYEAATHFALENQVLDPAVPAFAADDPAFRVFPRPSLERPAAPERLISVKRRLFETMSIVNGAAEETAKRLITDVRMLAERSRDRASAALAECWEGNLGIALGDNDAAVERFEAAERLYRTARAGSGDLFPVVLGKGIALRLLGRGESSAAELDRAIALMPDNPRAQVRYHANYGALFFYSDPKLRREHWEHAFSIAQENGLEDLAIHMDLDVASLDILDGTEGARERIERLIDQTTKRHFEDQLMRALVMGSAVDLVENEPRSALLRLEEARRVGYANDARRRLWKVHMNSATAYELLGERKLATHEQRTMLGVLTAVAWERRIVLAPGNIVLRAEEGEAAAGALLSLIPPGARESLNRVIEAVASGAPLTGRFPQEHLRSLPCGRRFVAL